jgi:hypothetical protein
VGRRGLAAALAALALAVGCSSGLGDPPVGELESVDVRPVRTSRLAAVLVVETDRPLNVEVTATSPEASFEIPRTARPADRHRIPVVGMRARTTYELAVEATTPSGEAVDREVVEFTTGPLPEFLPELDVRYADPERMAPGITLFDTAPWDLDRHARQPGGLLVGLDEEGEVVWYYRAPPSAGDARMTPDGTILVLYGPFGLREIDVLGNEVRAWTWGEAEGDEDVIVVQPETEIRSFHHEAFLAPSGNIFTLAHHDRPTTPAQQALCPDNPPSAIADDIVLEFTPEGEVVHEWSLADVVDPADVPGAVLCTDPGGSRDWAHSNGVILDPERNTVIVSARHLDLTIGIRHEDDGDGPSGELLWSLGPEGTLDLTEGAFAYHQHAPELEEDGSLMLYDNGNHRPEDEPYSRAVRYELDLEAGTARQVWEHRMNDLDGLPLYADFVGDADLQANGNVLIDHGGIGRFEGAPRARLVEIVPVGEEGGRIVFDVVLAEPYVSYRAERLPSLYAGPRWD